MKKFTLLFVIILAVVTRQLHSISLADYIEKNGMPAILYNHVLSLSDKNLTDVEGLQNIPNIGKVRIFNLSRNQLQTLPVEGLQNISHIDRAMVLDLSNNQLHTLPDDIFNGLNTLKVLHLNNNQLQTLPMDIFEGLKDLEYLSLQGNPFSTQFLLNLLAIIKNIPNLKGLDSKPVDEALESYRVYQPKTLQDISAESVMKKSTPEQLEQLAESNATAFNLLSLSQEQKTAIFQQKADIAAQKILINQK